MNSFALFSAGLLLFIHTTCTAGEADVLNVSAECNSNRVCTFKVTVRHDDTGWDHYADHWRVMDEKGNELGKRVLLHPHETEQPFTRSLSGISIPPEINHVTVEAHDNVHEYGGAKLTVPVP